VLEAAEIPLRDVNRQAQGRHRLVAADGAEAVRTQLAGSIEKVRAATIDVSKTYTNEFIR